VSGLDIGNFKHMQIVNDIKIAEKKVPTERAIARRAKKREEGNVEEEIEALKARAQGFLDTLSEEKSKDAIERLLPFITKMASDGEGLQQLAAIASAYLLSEAPAKSVAASKNDPQDSQEDDDESNNDSGANTDDSRSADSADIADEARADEPPESRRRRSGRSSGRDGGRSSGGGGGRNARGGDSSRGRRGGSGSRRS
jgi:hypothetical protein